MSSFCEEFQKTEKSSPCAISSRAAHSQSRMNSRGERCETTVQSDQVYTAECVHKPVCVQTDAVQLEKPISAHAMGIHAGQEEVKHTEEEFTNVKSLIED